MDPTQRMATITNPLNHPGVQALLETLSGTEGLASQQQVTTSLRTLSTTPREPLATLKRRNSAPSSGLRRLSTSSSECSPSPSPVSLANQVDRSDSVHHPSLVGLEVAVLPHLLPRHIQSSTCVLGVVESSSTSVAQVRLLHQAVLTSITLPLSQLNPVVPQVEDSVTVIKGPLAGSKGVLKGRQDCFVLACGNKEFLVYDLSILGKSHVSPLQNTSSLSVSDCEQQVSSDGGIDVLAGESSPGVQQAMSVCESPSPAPSPFIPGLSPLQLGPSSFNTTNEGSPENSITSTPTLMGIAGDSVTHDDIAMVNGESWTVSQAPSNCVVSPPCHMTSSNMESLSLSNTSHPGYLQTSSSHMTQRSPETVTNGCQLSPTDSHMTYANNSYVPSDYNHSDNVGLDNVGFDNVGSSFDIGCMVPASSYPVSVGNSCASNFTSMASLCHPPSSCSEQYLAPHSVLMSPQDRRNMYLAHPHSQASVYNPNSLVGVQQQNNPNYLFSRTEQNSFSTVFSPRPSHSAYLPATGYPASMKDLAPMTQMGMMMPSRTGGSAGLNSRMYMHPHLAANSIHPGLIGMSPPAYRASPCPTYSPVPPATPHGRVLNHQQPFACLQQAHPQSQRAHCQLSPPLQTVPQPASKMHPCTKDFSQTTPMGGGCITGINSSFGKGKCIFFKHPPSKEHEELKKLVNCSTKETCRFNPFSRFCQRQPVRVPILIEKVLNTLLLQEPPLAWYSWSQSKGSGEDELLEGSVRVSSICPLTKHKMEYPCRGLQCTHLQCFDAKAFLELALKRRWMCQKSSSSNSSTSWKCPICSKTLAPRQLCIDKRLKKAIESSGARELEHREPGEWIPVAKCAPEEPVDVIDLTDDG